MGRPPTRCCRCLWGAPQLVGQAVLLADILPSLLIKMAAPFGAHLVPYR